MSLEHLHPRLPDHPHPRLPDHPHPRLLDHPHSWPPEHPHPRPPEHPQPRPPDHQYLSPPDHRDQESSPHLYHQLRPTVPLNALVFQAPKVTGLVFKISPAKFTFASFNANRFFRKSFAILIIFIMIFSDYCDARSILSEKNANFINGVKVRDKRASQGTQLSSSSSLHSTTPSIFQSSQSSKGANSPSPAPATTPSSEQTPTPIKNKDITQLISDLQKLKILEQRSDSCIGRVIIQNNPSIAPQSQSSGQSSVGIVLVFDAVPQSLHASDSRADLNQNSSADGTNSSKSPTALPILCHNYQIQLGGADAPSTPPPENIHRLDHNETMVGAVSDERKDGLSRTQIVVISTCSAIIGMFFIIAAILRIRNYIKRARHEQAMANRPKFRSCSVALRNPTQSMEQLRRDSLISRTSQQNSITTKGSNGSQTNGSSQENSSSSSPRHEPDTTPLLVITRPPGGTDYPTPTESHSSLQYMDDDTTAPKKKAIPPVSLVKNGSIEGCYIVALKQAQIGHAPLAIMERGDSVKARPLMERGSSLKVRSNRPAVSVERRTSLKYNLPSSTKKDVSKSYKYNGGSVKRKLDGNGNPRFNGEAHIYQLVGSSEIIIADKNFYLEPRTNGSYEKSLRKTSKGYQIVSRNELDDETILEMHSGKQNERRLHKTEFTVESTREINCEDQNGPETLDKKERTALRKNLHREINREISEVEDNRKPENDELDLISPLTESSYFGLSQSDASLSSTTNQGNEFFGQTEYVCSDPHGSTDLSASNSTPDCGDGTLCPSYNHGYMKSPENIRDVRDFFYEQSAMNGESSAQDNLHTYNSNTNLSQTNADGSPSCADTDGVPRYNGLPQKVSSANNSPSKAKHGRRAGELDNIDNENQSKKETRNVGLINAIAIPDQVNGN